MKISVPRERKEAEKRVGITPAGVEYLSSLGHELFIEEGAGLGSSFSDSEYASAGAKITKTLKETWEQATLLVKVKEPAPEEYEYLRPNLKVFSFLHPAASRTLTDALINSGVLGIDYDLVQSEDGRLCILEPMSIIAGKLAIHAAADSLLSHNKGKGLLIDGVPGVPSANVLVIGAGVSGSAAAKRAYSLGCTVTVLDLSTTKLSKLKELCPGIRTLFSNRGNLLNELKNADIVVGAVLIPGGKAPVLIQKQDLQIMKKGSVVVDISIDQGGMLETSKATSLTNPTYVVDGIIHYMVSNMPAMVPETSTQALTNETISWIKLIASGVLDSKANATKSNQEKSLIKSIVCKDSKLRNQKIAEAFGLPYSLIE